MTPPLWGTNPFAFEAIVGDRQPSSAMSIEKRHFSHRTSPFQLVVKKLTVGAHELSSWLNVLAETRAPAYCWTSLNSRSGATKSLRGWMSRSRPGRTERPIIPYRMSHPRFSRLRALDAARTRGAGTTHPALPARTPAPSWNQSAHDRASPCEHHEKARRRNAADLIRIAMAASRAS